MLYIRLGLINPYLSARTLKAAQGMSQEDYEEVLRTTSTSSCEEIITKLREMILQVGIPDTVGVCAF